MKALVWYGERSIEFEEIAAPEPSPGEVIVDIELAGICGSDLHGYRGHPGPRVPPLVLGHEVVVRHNGGRYAIYPIIGASEYGWTFVASETDKASQRGNAKQSLLRPTPQTLMQSGSFRSLIFATNKTLTFRPLAWRLMFIFSNRPCIETGPSMRSFND